MHYESPVDPAIRGSENDTYLRGDAAARGEGDFDTELTVNDAVARFPATMGVFNRFGIDTCCGGGISIAEAAQRDEIALGELVKALQQAVAGA
ncbi:MAG TPA: DUF542 domain-containing protein [Gemmatimonadaceae bacterium]|jgi:Regulator of cell morphogenesis and NO signaling